MKTKIIYSFLIMLGFATYATGQTTDAEAKLRKQSTDTIEGWKLGGVASLSLSQAAFVNWAGGGQNSIAINGLVSSFANYKKGKSVWDNSLDLGYGIMRLGKDASFQKTDDKVDFLSIYGQQAYKKWYYSALMNFRTQMAPGYNYPNDSVKISNLLAPAYVIGAVGMDYKPNKNFSAFIAPVTGKVTIVNDQILADAGAFGVDAAVKDTAGNIITGGKNIRTEFGGYIRVIFTKSDFEQELLKNVSFTTKLDLFSNYLQNPQYIDVSWQTLIALKVNKFLTVNLTTHLLYDYDILIAKDTNDDGKPDKMERGIQFKEILGVGVAYQF